MKTLIPTDHALFRQWDRSIDNLVISKIAPLINDSRNKKQVVMVMPTFFRAHQINGFENQCLVLVVRGKYLITCYQRGINECFFCQKYYTNPQIIY